MTENLVQDQTVQAAVSKLQLRSERQENLEQLVATFVDPGVSVQLLNENNQILYGRRGTGKTHVLKVVQQTVQNRLGELAVYIDMRTLGSSSIFNDEGRSAHVRVASLLRDVLALVEGALLEWATRPATELPGLAFEALNELAASISRTTIADAEVLSEEHLSASRTSSDATTIEISKSPAFTVGSKKAHELTTENVIQRSGTETNLLLFGDVAKALDKVIKASGIVRMTLLLDEWTAVPFDLQPLLAEFLKRSLFGNPAITTKIASIEYRSNFSEPMGHNNVLGFELGADVSSHIELDDYFVYDRNPEQTAGMFSQLLFRHIAAETATTDVPSYLEDQYGAKTHEDFINALFASRERFPGVG